MKKEKGIEEINRILTCIAFVLAMFTCFSCFLFIEVEDKQCIAFIPFAYAFISIIFKKNFYAITSSVPKLVIQALYYVRLVVLPLLYSGCDNYQLYEGNMTVDDNISSAVILMVYEYFAVQLMIYLIDNSNGIIKSKGFRFVTNFNLTDYIIVLLTIYVIVVYIFLPSCSESFKTIFSLSDADFAVGVSHVEYSTGSINRVLKTLFSIGVQLIRVLLPALCLYKIYIKGQNSRLSTVILILSCSLQFVFLTSTFAEAIVSSLAIILFYIKLYPERRKRTFLFLIICTAGMVVLYFTVRYFVNSAIGMYSNDSGVILYFAQIINAYFTGIDNVAAIFNIESGHQAEAFKSGMIGAIPFNSTIFGLRGNKLQFFFNSANRSYGQIPPTIGAGYYYFGYILSPIISMLFVYMSLKLYEKSERIGKSLKYVPCVFSSIVFALGTVMYSPSITLSWYLSWGVIMQIITSFSKGKVDTIKES